MKKDIHPKFVDAVIRCACGATYHTRSTRAQIMVDICSACHPFFTGKQKLIDTAGRIDRFKKKFGDRVVSAPKRKKQPAPAAKTQAVDAPPTVARATASGRGDVQAPARGDWAKPGPLTPQKA